jgi:hypothetical protein
MRTNAGKKAAGVVLFIVMASLLAPPARGVLPPDPDNAALLYYQAFLTLAELDDEARKLISNVAKGDVAPDDKVREYIQQCHGAIEFAEAAADVPACDWGLRFSQGFDALMPQLAQIRFLAFVLTADARVRAADGDYRGALERCLMTGTLARHVGDDTLVSYLVSLAVRTLGYKCMQDVMGQAAGDVELLRWLGGELATDPGKELSAARPLKIEMEIVLDLMQMDKIDRLAKVLAETDAKKLKEIVAAADEEILAQARQVYGERATAVLKTFSMSLPYEEAHARLKKAATGFDPNDRVSAAVGAFMPAMSRVYTLKIKAEAQANAVKAGVEICLARAKSGRLPKTLPEGLPKDAFSGEDFEYKLTDDGFVLRCRKPDLDKNETYEYAFVLK